MQVVTGDKDFIQIVDEDVRLFDPMKDVHTGPEEVKAKLGIEPKQMRDYLALVGDTVRQRRQGARHRSEDGDGAAPAVRRRGDAAGPAGRGEEAEDPRGASASHRESLLQGPAARHLQDGPGAEDHHPGAGPPADRHRARQAALHGAGVLPAGERAAGGHRRRGSGEARRARGSGRPRDDRHHRGGAEGVGGGRARGGHGLPGAGLRGQALHRAAGGPGARAAGWAQRLRAAAPPGARRPRRCPWRPSPAHPRAAGGRGGEEGRARSQGAHPGAGQRGAHAAGRS